MALPAFPGPVAFLKLCRKAKMEYDEIRITTRREIDICVGAIRQLEREIAAMGKKDSVRSIADRQEFEAAGDGPTKAEFTRWRDSCLALERWKERLQAHLQIMEL